jgi:hypothetical protein
MNKDYPATATILELRTSRDSEHTPESAAQLFSTIPKLKNSLFDRIAGKNESLSFEILVQNQTIYFLCHCPTRLVEYVKSALIASYPQLLITKIEGDPLQYFLPGNQTQFETHNQQPFLELGKLKLSQQEAFSLKTYHDFSEVDPLSSLLSVLSQAQPLELILLQLIVSPDSDSWKHKGWQIIENSKPSGDETAPTASDNEPTHQEYIKKKLNIVGLKSSLKMAVLTADPNRSQLLIEHIGSSLNAITQSQGNSLKSKRIKFFKQHFLQTILRRNFCRSKKMHLSVDELATIYHLPNNKLASIPNIAWGKKLLGEPPENLPIVTKTTDAKTKQLNMA